MNSVRNNLDHPPGFSLVDIYFVIFRRKWLIIIFTLLGLVAAAVFFFTKQPPYQSSAKFMIKYITDVNPILNPGANGSQVTATIDPNASRMNAEIQMLTSFDLYERVATNIGPEKILAKFGGGSDPISAAEVLNGGVKVEPLRDSTVIQITLSHPDQNIVRPALAAITEAYKEKHKAIHLDMGVSADTILEQTASLQQQIAQTESELRMVKTNTGIVDVEAADRAYMDETSRIRRELLQAETLLAELQGAQAAIGGTKAATSKPQSNTVEGQKIFDELVARYKAVCSRVDFQQKRLSEYLLVQGYTDENKLVKETQVSLAEAIKLKNSLEEQNPSLTLIGLEAVASPNAASGNGSAQLSSLPIRIQTLRKQLKQVQAEAITLGDAEARIFELQRKKKIQESYLENWKTTQMRRSFDESMGPGQLSANIPDIQPPTPPFRDFKSFYKKVFTLMFGGLGIGLALAFILELYLDRSIKRPIEVQTKLKIPFFLSIPDLNQGMKKSLSAPNRKLLGGGSSTASVVGGAVAIKETPLEVMSWEVNRRFDSYYDALRDRLVVYFESINLTRKPKLVAVTSTHKGAGVSTIAAGLASSLSETGDGRVLLVDMNLENGAAQQFFKGRPNCKLDDALESETRDGALVSENLYVVTEDTVTDRLPRALPKRFASLIPKLKASDYDYIIFDMPPVSPTSVTARLSGFMDTVMLVIESEKTDQQVVQQANALLAQSKANVTAVLNKTKTYIPKQLHQDFLSDT
jgi:polysaccharide biosynthesis transport protein